MKTEKEAPIATRTLKQIDSELREKVLFRMLAKARGETRTDGFDVLLDEFLIVRRAEDMKALEQSSLADDKVLVVKGV